MPFLAAAGAGGAGAAGGGAAAGGGMSSMLPALGGAAASQGGKGGDSGGGLPIVSGAKNTVSSMPGNMFSAMKDMENLDKPAHAQADMELAMAKGTNAPAFSEGKPSSPAMETQDKPASAVSAPPPKDPTIKPSVTPSPAPSDPQLDDSGDSSASAEQDALDREARLKALMAMQQQA